MADRKADRRRGRAALTLLELLIVIAVLILLVAMLAPMGSHAWDVLQQTQCASNLHTIWQAYNTCHADYDYRPVAHGIQWRAVVGPYTEGREDPFRCPAAEGRVGEGGGADAGFAPGRVSFDRLSFGDLTFRMYCKEAGRPGTGGMQTGEFLGTAVVQECQGVEIVDMGGGKYRVGIEDRYFFANSGWHGGYDDIRFLMWTEGGEPYKVQVLGGDEGKGMSYYSFKFDFYVGEKLVCEDFVLKHNEVIDLREAGLASGYGGAGYVDTVGYTVCDYGMSSGAYEVAGRRLAKLEGKRFFVLDYAKPLADYNRDNEDDDWNKHFILSPEDWERDFASEASDDETWASYQSLRHFGRANVLFCDGHVEALAPAVEATPQELIDGRHLDETSPLWRREQ